MQGGNLPFIYKMSNHLHLCVPEIKSTENLKGIKCSFTGHCTLFKTTELEYITKYMYGGNLPLV